MKLDCVFSSKTIYWQTPPNVFKKYNDIYHFDIDVCATDENAKCDKYYTQSDDAFTKSWYGKCWMNPPYGRSIKNWIKKAYDQVKCGNADLVCCLIPARTDTAWWHDYAMKGDIQFIRGRIHFGGSKNPAQFPSAVVVFKRTNIFT